MLLSVSQTAKKLNISRQKVYRYIEKMNLEHIDGTCHNVTGDVTGDVTGQYKAIIFINDVGFNYISNLENKPNQNDKPSQEITKSDSELINSLLEQLRAKDRQIEMLLKQAENYQVLLAKNFFNLLSTDATENQDTDNKRSFFHRFRKKPK